MAKRNVADVLWLALQYAKQDRISFIGAYDEDIKVKAVRDAIADIKAIETLQLKLFGTTRSRLEAELAKMKPVNIFDVRRLIESGELEVDEGGIIE